MRLTGKLNFEMVNIAQSMKNGVDNCKLDGKIVEQQKKIKELIKEVGNLAVVRLDAGDHMSPEIMERYTAIKEAEEKISELEKKRKVSGAVCPNCGAKTSIAMRYCGKCGSNMMEES